MGDSTEDPVNSADEAGKDEDAASDPTDESGLPSDVPEVAQATLGLDLPGGNED